MYAKKRGQGKLEEFKELRIKYIHDSTVQSKSYSKEKLQIFINPVFTILLFNLSKYKNAPNRKNTKQHKGF